MTFLHALAGGLFALAAVLILVAVALSSSLPETLGVAGGLAVVAGVVLLAIQDLTDD
jgi:hypothetical protein